MVGRDGVFGRLGSSNSGLRKLSFDFTDGKFSESDDHLSKSLFNLWNHANTMRGYF
jgi:hypothetical protein